MLRRRGVFHPATLWLLAFSFTTTLYALHLLPYRPMRVETAALLIGASLSLIVGTELGDRLVQRRTPLRSTAADSGAEDDHPEARRPHLTPAAQRMVAIAAALALLGMVAWSALFVAQVAQIYGLRSALVSSYTVRLGLSQDNIAAVGIKYVYATLAASALCAFAAANAPRLRSRWAWGGGVILTAAAAYLSTGRSNVILPIVIAAVTYGIATGLRPSVRAIAATGLAGVVIVLGVFTVGGSIIGKTFEANPLRTVPSVLTDHRSLQIFALPYQYATGPIAALGVQVTVAKETPSTDGCAVFAIVCQVGGAAGLDTIDLPAIRPFTREPMPWNTYTALDRPILDAGAIGVLLCFLGVGGVLGALWRRADAGDLLATPVYGVLGSAVLYAPIQNNFLAPHIVAGCLLALLAVGVARVGLSLWARRGPTPQLSGQASSD